MGKTWQNQFWSAFSHTFPSFILNLKGHNVTARFYAGFPGLVCDVSKSEPSQSIKLKLLGVLLCPREAMGIKLG